MKSEERVMKMKAFCLKVIHDFIKSGAVKIIYKGNAPLFDFDLFKTNIQSIGKKVLDYT